MISNLEKLETQLGQYEDWTEATLLQIVQDESLLEMFTPELATYLFETRDNDNLIDILLPVKYGYQLREVQKKISENIEKLENSEIDLTEFKENILLIKNKGTLFSKVSAYLTILIMLPEIDLLEESEEISDLLDVLIKVIEEIDFDNGIEVVFDILELLIPIREIYFEKYEIDLLKDKEILSDIFDKLNKKTQTAVDSLIENAEEENEDSVGE
jgi:hypothetical protein